MASDRVVLGIVDGLHDAGAALVRGGRLVAAANEERFTRVKLQGGMPRRSIAAVLETADVGPEDVDVIAVGGRTTPTLATRLVRPLQRLYAPSLGICFDRPWHPVDRIGDLVRYRLSLTRARGDRGLGRVAGPLAEPAVRRGLPRGLRGRPLRFVDHHLAHAESAWRTAGDGTWLVVTADAHGDGRSLTVYDARPGRPLALLHDVGVKQSLGAFYSYVTKRLGFVPGRHEGKTLGLAASGRPETVPLPFPFRFAEGRLHYEGTWGLRCMKALRALESLRREDVAAWVQAGTLDVLVALVAHWLQVTGRRRVALAGGVFANVAVNGVLAALPEVERLVVFPHMGDGGLAAGAALHVADAVPQALETALLGPAWDDGAARSAAVASGLPCTEPDDPDEALAEALAGGLPAVRCTGRMEFGPRALGARSVLAPADDPAIAAPLNAALRRDGFMPLAPAIRHEDAPEAFEHYAEAADAARFMTVALPARRAFQGACPAAVHVDGTARPQAVRREDDPDLHRLMGRLAEATGRPGVVNTSFNLHEEPIVCTPADALRAFRQSGLPVMRLGPCVLRQDAHGWRARLGGAACETGR